VNLSFDTVRHLEPDIRAKIEDFISGFLSDQELESHLLKWQLMKREGIINDIKSAIIGNFHGEVFNDYQNIHKDKYGEGYILTQEQFNDFNVSFIEWAKPLRTKLDRMSNI